MAVKLRVILAVLAVMAVRGDPSDAGVTPVARDRPGTLLLNMLIKNEAFHLERSLPKWAPLIDYWIIGVDDKNTDNSEEIIHKYLGHIPGQTVSFLLPSPARLQLGCAPRSCRSINLARRRRLWSTSTEWALRGPCWSKRGSNSTRMRLTACSLTPTSRRQSLRWTSGN